MMFMTIDLLFKLLQTEEPSRGLLVFDKELFELIPELKECVGFNQNNEWHVYDVFKHILCVVDNVPNDLVLRVAALFHDVGKPLSYTEDENGVGHFYGHWEESKKIFDRFAEKYQLDDEFKTMVSNLIFYHDKNVEKMTDEEKNELCEIFGEDGIKKLFQLKTADLLAQNEKYHHLIQMYKEQEEKLHLK